MLSSEARVDSRSPERVSGGNRLAEADHGCRPLSEAPLFIDDTPAITVLEMKAKARRLKAESGLD